MAKNKELVIIEDNPADYALYVRLLDSVKHDFSGFRYFNNIKTGAEYLINHPPTCCLTDFRLPDGSAKDLLQKIVTATGELNFPIVVATGQENSALADELNKLGVQDFLLKGKLTASGLGRALNSAVSTFGLQKELYVKTHYDPLSGFLNRAFFFDVLEKDIKDSQRFKASLCLICVQVTDIQAISDNHGRETADILIKLIAENIKSSIEDSDASARLNHDEFAVILRSAESHKGHYIAQKLLKKLAVTFSVTPDISVTLNPSIGLAIYNGTAQNSKEFFNQAHLALQQAKRSQGSEYKKYLRELDSKFERKRQLELEINDAISNNELQLKFFPVYSLERNDIDVVEVLVHWELDGDQVDAKDISDLCNAPKHTIGYHDWLFKSAFSQLNQWRSTNPNVKIALNITTKNINNKQIIENLFARLYQYNLAPKDIVLDIAENQLIHQLDETRSLLNVLASQGTLIAIDNFGSGFASIAYIASINCHSIKIDPRFMTGSDVSIENVRIVKSIVAFAHALDLTVVGEGVENANAYSLAKTCGCDAVQGSFFGAATEGHADWSTFIQGFESAAIIPRKNLSVVDKSSG